jgi:hypothetical protein
VTSFYSLIHSDSVKNIGQEAEATNVTTLKMMIDDIAGRIQEIVRAFVPGLALLCLELIRNGMWVVNGYFVVYLLDAVC